MINLIGLTGCAENSKGERIGSAKVGKDEIGLYLKNKGWIQTSFAEPIYKIVHHAFGVPISILGSPTHYEKEVQIYEPWGMTLREMLQKVGSGLFRHHVDPDFWVKHLENRLTQIIATSTVITDVRMPNEAAMIRSRGGTIIHVHRKVSTGAIRKHETETQVEIFPEDLHIYNYGDSFKNLYAIVNEIIRIN